MDKISTLFTAIGDIFAGTDWFQAIQWPFWTLVFLVAIGGVYCARFGKNTLACLGVNGAMKLTMIYLIAAALHHLVPHVMADFSQLPFLAVSESGLRLTSPLGLLDRWTSALPQTMVRLYFLLFCLNLCGLCDYSGQRFPSWCGSQILSCGFGLLIYSAVTFAIANLPIIPPKFFYLSFSVIFLAVTLFLLGGKVLFTVFIKGTGNEHYDKFYRFFTQNPAGKLFTVTTFSTLFLSIFLILVNYYEVARFPHSAFNMTAYVIVTILCTFTLYVFSMFYTSRSS